MKKSLISICLVLVLLVTMLSAFSVVGAEEKLVYSQGFGRYASNIPEGQTWYLFTNESSGASWHAGSTAGSFATVWLVNDDKAKNGPYLVAKPYNDDKKLYYLTQDNDVESGKKGRLAFTKSFVFEFSFNFLSKRPDGVNRAGVPKIMVNIFPEASTTSNGRSGEGNILSIPYEGTITAVNDAATVNGNAYTTSLDVWYDVKVIADMSTKVPTYSAYIKKSADSEYTAVVEGMSFPKNGNYTKGLGLFSILTLRQNSTYALDDLKIYYYNEKHTITLSECKNGSLSFAEGFSSPVEKGESVTINVTPASGYQVKDGKVKVNGAEYTVSNGQITFAVNEDSKVEAEFEEYDGKKIIDILLDSCDRENVFFELDTRHVAIGGSSPVEYAKKYSGRIPFLHVRDTDMKEDTAIGCGVVDFKAVTEAAGDVEWLIIENPWLGSNLEQIRTSVKYINDNLLNKEV